MVGEGIKGILGGQNGQDIVDKFWVFEDEGGEESEKSRGKILNDEKKQRNRRRFLKRNNRKGQVTGFNR